MYFLWRQCIFSLRDTGENDVLNSMFKVHKQNCVITGVKNITEI